MSFTFKEMVLQTKHHNNIRFRESKGFYDGIDSLQYAIDYVRSYYQQQNEEDIKQMSPENMDPLVFQACAGYLYKLKYMNVVNQTIKQFVYQYEKQENKDVDKLILPEEAQRMIKQQTLLSENPLRNPQYMEQYLDQKDEFEEFGQIIVYDDNYSDDTDMFDYDEEDELMYSNRRELGNNGYYDDQDNYPQGSIEQDTILDIEPKEDQENIRETRVDLGEVRKPQIDCDEVKKEKRKNKIISEDEQKAIEKGLFNQMTKEEEQWHVQSMDQFIKDSAERERVLQLGNSFHTVTLNSGEKLYDKEDINEEEEEQISNMEYGQETSQDESQQRDHIYPKQELVDSTEINEDQKQILKDRGPKLTLKRENKKIVHEETSKECQQSGVITDRGTFQIHIGEYLLVQETEEESIALDFTNHLQRQNLAFIPLLWSPRTNSYNKCKRIVQKYFKKRYLTSSKYVRDLEFTQITTFIHNSCEKQDYGGLHQIIEKHNMVIYHRLDPTTRKKNTRIVGLSRNFYLLEMKSSVYVDQKELRKSLSKIIFQATGKDFGLIQMLGTVSSYFQKYREPYSKDLKEFHQSMKSFQQRWELEMDLCNLMPIDMLEQLGKTLNQLESLVFYNDRANALETCAVKWQ